MRPPKAWAGKTYGFTAGKQVYVLASAHFADSGMQVRRNQAPSLAQKDAPLVRMSAGIFTLDRNVLSLFTSLQSSSTNMYTRTIKQSIYTLSRQISLALICQCP